MLPHKKDDSDQGRLANPSLSDVAIAKAYFDSGTALTELSASGIESERLYTTERVAYKAGPFSPMTWGRVPQPAGFGWVLGELLWDIGVPPEEQRPSDPHPGYDREAWLTILTDKGLLAFGQHDSIRYGKYELFDSSLSEFRDWVAAEQAVKRLLSKG